MWVAGVVIILFLLWGGLEFFKTMGAKAAVRRLESDWKEIESKYKKVTDMESAALKSEKKVDALNQFSTNRVLWSGLLDALQRSAVPNVQLSRVVAGQTYTPADVMVASRAVAGAKPVNAKVPVVREKVVLRLTAKDYGTINDNNYQKLKTALLKTPFFANAIAESAISLEDRSAPTQDPVTGTFFTTMTVRFEFPEKERKE